MNIFISCPHSPKFICSLHQVSRKYNISTIELVSLWNETYQDCQLRQKEESSVLPDISSLSVSSSCSYIMTRGKNKGTNCDCQVSDKSKSGKYCLKHLKEDEPKSARKKRTIIREPRETDEEDEAVIEIRQNQYGHYVLQDTSLVLNKDRMVIGREASDGSILPLTEEDVKFCKKNFLKYVSVVSLDDEKEEHNSDDE